MRVGLAVLGMWFLAAGSGAVAAEVKGLYEAEVPVAGQDEVARREAMPGALRAVLARLVRRETLAEGALMKALLAEAAQHAQSFSYVTAEGGALRLRVQFAAASVNRALASRHIAYWGAQRPEVLTWLSVDDGGQRRLALAGDAELGAPAQQAAQERGLPLRLPAPDESVQARLEDLAAADDGRMVAASSRYGADAVLAGQLRKKSEQLWQAEWRLWLGGSMRRWSGDYPSLTDALRGGFAGAYDGLAERYVAAAGAAGEDSSVELQVEGLASPADLASVSRYLESFASDHQVQWLGLDGQSARFRLNAAGGPAALANQLAAGGRLQPGGEAEGGVPRYRWKP